MAEIDAYYKLKHASNDWKEFFRECGRKGGKAKSVKKTRACRKNGLIAKIRRLKSGK